VHPGTVELGSSQPGPTAVGGTWAPITNAATFPAAFAILLTDGTVAVHELEGVRWFKLTPDVMGSYANGTWTQLASAPNSHAPLYFGSAVLPDGRLVVEGGEYDGMGGGAAETTKGDIYDPVTDKWTVIAPPSGWTQIGDASGIVLADGRFMLASCCTAAQAILDASTLTWTATGMGKKDQNSEESWTLLWDNTVLTVDVFDAAHQAEIYDPTTGTWSNGGDPKVVLADAGFEIGPGVLRSDGTVFETGATGHTSIYDTHTKTWTVGPDFPKINGTQQLDIADGPCALLPNDNVLCVASPGDYTAPSHFFEWNGTALTEVAAIAGAAADPSYQVGLLVLPTGQVLSTDFSTDIELYTPVQGATDARAPYVESLPELVTSPSARATPPRPLPADAPYELPLTTLHHGRTYSVWIKRMNGISQANFYGDDMSNASNYPLVRLTNMTSQHVRYARTHDHSTSAIGYDVEGTTHFDVPADVELGTSTMEIVTNGIASPPITVEVD
jgi:hypothetical protein